MENKGKKAMKRKKEGDRSKGRVQEEKSMYCFLKGMAAAMAVTAIIFIGFGILLTYTTVSEDKIPLVSLGTTAISAVIAGFDWAKCAGSRGILWGILAGIVYILLIFLIAGFGGGGFTMGATKLVLLIVAAAGGGVGGILGINMKKS